jgi:hypothetical protein
MRTLTIQLLAVLLLLPGVTMAIEEPEFELVAKADDYDIRRYESYVVAEVLVDGSFKASGNTAFQILADYIFGANTDSQKMEMTAPVESRSSDTGTRMEMTAPVLSAQKNGTGEQYVYAFVIERRYTLESVPKPLDERVTLRETGERTVAVRRYSGTWSRGNFEKNRSLLLEALNRDGVATVGEPYLARYNSPFAPWFLRRNEVIVEIASTGN